MLGCCRTAVVPDRCGRFSAHGRSGRNVPWFCGSLSGIRGFGGVLPPAVSRTIFTNRGFPTFPWGQYPRGCRIPVNSQPDTGEQARTGKSQQFSRIIHIPPPESRPPPPPSTLTVIPASADASTDTDNSPNVNRRLHRHRQPPQRQQTLLPTLTVHSASANGRMGKSRCGESFAHRSRCIGGTAQAFDIT